MKLFSIVVILIIAWFVYKFFKSPDVAASGNTTSDDKKNVFIKNPQLTNGIIVPVDTNGNNFENVPVNYGDISALPKFLGTRIQANLDGLTNNKTLMSNDNTISNVAPVRQDSINPLEVAITRGIQPGVIIDGTRYNGNEVDVSSAPSIPIPVIQLYAPLSPDARVNDNFSPQPISLDTPDDIPLLARA